MALTTSALYFSKSPEKPIRLDRFEGLGDYSRCENLREDDGLSVFLSRIQHIQRHRRPVETLQNSSDFRIFVSPVTLHISNRPDQPSLL